MEYLCKITTSNYIAYLKKILKNNQASGRSDPPPLESLRENIFEKHGHVCFLYAYINVFVTIQHNVFSNTALSLLRHEVQCFKLTL